MSTKITITEALAEVKNIPARIAKKQEAIMRYFHRDSRMLDPLAKDGAPGSEEFIRRERQGISDLSDRLVRIRCAIQKANLATNLDIDGKVRSVSYWLNWRREVSGALPSSEINQRKFLNIMASAVTQIRQQAMAKGWTAESPSAERKEQQILINVDEALLAKEVEEHEALLGKLDGKLALINATTLIDPEGEQPDIPF